ncbi:54S ribosomal protein L6 mitochondrial [Pleosporales sp. CAS-2024a]
MVERNPRRCAGDALSRDLDPPRRTLQLELAKAVFTNIVTAMFAPARRRCAQWMSRPSAQPYDFIPTFLLPVFARTPLPRNFTTTSPCQSKIGSMPLSVPQGVTLNVMAPSNKGRGTRAQPMSTVHIKGPLGELSMEVPPYININQDPKLSGPTLSIQDPTDAKQKAMWGTTRAYLQNHILGVSEGHSAILRFVGVGFRASVETTATTVQAEYPGQKFVNLKVGYSHPVELGIPKGVTASTPQPTRLLLEGPKREVVMQFAANIRKWRVPEPYKGKGIFVDGEEIKLKNKKIK